MKFDHVTVSCTSCGEVFYIDLHGDGLDGAEIAVRFEEHRRKHEDVDALWEIAEPA